jgi:hypothetical protein
MPRWLISSLKVIVAVHLIIFVLKSPLAALILAALILTTCVLAQVAFNRYAHGHWSCCRHYRHRSTALGIPTPDDPAGLHTCLWFCGACGKSLYTTTA